MNAMPQKDERLSRRGFLGWLLKGSLAGSALLGLGMLGRFISFHSAERQENLYDLGAASDYPVGTRKVVADGQAMLMSTEEGFRAVSLVCPHLGCIVNMTGEGFRCPCHGSRYWTDGSLRNGPASRPLADLKVEVNQKGHLILLVN
jgi:cytochrome b6-f complex iron-sulfur subunit